MKECNKCKNTKESVDFNKSSTSKDGLYPYCKSCVREFYLIRSQETKDKFLSKVKEYRLTDEYKAVQKKYMTKPEIVLKRREWKRAFDKKYLANPLNRISNNMRGNMHHALKAKKAARKWETLAGYTLQDLITHLEPQLNNGMTWDNYGEVWHIDHIKPKSWFTYQSTDDPQFKECWSLSNLQPLLKLDNIKKGNRFIG